MLKLIIYCLGYFRVTFCPDNVYLLRVKHRLNLAPKGEAVKNREYF